MKIISFFKKSKTKQKELEILVAVSILFMKYGIKNLTMDNISSHLGISKKTLYLYVSNKKDLVKKVLEFEINKKKYFH